MNFISPNVTYVFSYAFSTYDKVRLIIQPWRKPEGGINKPILKMMLESVMLFLMMKPGSTENTLQDRYLPYLQPMVLQIVVKVSRLTLAHKGVTTSWANILYYYSSIMLVNEKHDLDIITYNAQ